MITVFFRPLNFIWKKLLALGKIHGLAHQPDQSFCLYSKVTNLNQTKQHHRLVVAGITQRKLVCCLPVSRCVPRYEVDRMLLHGLWTVTVYLHCVMS